MSDIYEILKYRDLWQLQMALLRIKTFVRGQIDRHYFAETLLQLLSLPLALKIGYSAASQIPMFDSIILAIVQMSMFLGYLGEDKTYQIIGPLESLSVRIG